MEKLKDLIYDQLVPKFEHIEDERLEFIEKIKFRKRLMWITGICLIALFATYVYFNFDPGKGASSNIFYVFAFNGILGIISLQHFLIKSIIQEYKLTYKDLVISPIVTALEPNAKYNSFNHIPHEDYKHAGLFEKGYKSFKGEDLIKGEIDKTWYNFSEMLVKGETGGEDSTTYTIFKGLFVMADFHKHFNGWTVVIPERRDKNMLTRGGFRKLEVAMMENTLFEDKYKVLTSDQVEARYILSLAMMENILELEKTFDAPVALSFKDSKVYLTIPWKTNMLEPDYRKPANDRATIYKFFSELKQCFAIIDNLNLNTRIWTKE